MSSRPEHPLHLLTGAYALDALPEPERRELEDHLATCAACATEAAELAETATRLAGLTERAAPAGLREAVLRAAETTRQLPPIDEPARDTGAEIGGPVDEVARRRAGRRRLGWVAGSALLGAAAATVVVLALGDRTDPMGEVLAATDARTMTADVTGGGTAMMVMSERADAGVIMFSGLPELAAEQTYQMWIIADSTPAPEDAFTPSTAGAASVLLEGAPRGDAVALTIEPAGGSAEPTSDPVVVLPLSG